MRTPLPFLYAILLMATSLAVSAQMPAKSKSASALQGRLSACRQLILVVSPGWKSVPAQLQCFSRSSAAKPWRPVAGLSNPCVLGRNGLAWGLGVHGSSAPEDPAKKEGDGCAPAGVFELDSIFGDAPAAGVRYHLPYHQMTASWAGVDDPHSHYYNRLVDKSTVPRVDWTSAEDMVPASGVYQRGIVVRHNWAQVPGAGSCIFLHIWRGPGQPTSGCTAMEAAQVERIASWLDPAKRPLLVQLPQAEYAKWKVNCRLP